MPVIPIKRLELEFIPSNATGFDKIVKINIIRTPGITGDIEFLTLYKYIIDKSDKSLFDDASQYLQYMSNSVYMSTDIFMGGIDISSYAKDIAQLEISSTRIEDFKFLLDYMVDGDDVLIYNLVYTYNSVEYTTPLVISYNPIDSAPLREFYERPCITLRNLRYIGINESYKYSKMHKEMFCDIRRLESIYSDITAEINTKAEIMDSNLNSLYNIMDSITYYNMQIIQQ